MANLRLTNALRNALANQFQLAIDAGPAAGTIKIYSGTQPATADTALSGNTLLATLTFADPSAPIAVAGVLTFNPIVEDSSADATGIASFARIADSNAATVFDCDVGVAGATINLNTTNLVSGGPVRITSFTITVPAG